VAPGAGIGGNEFCVPRSDSDRAEQEPPRTTAAEAGCRTPGRSAQGRRTADPRTADLRAAQGRPGPGLLPGAGALSRTGLPLRARPPLLARPALRSGLPLGTAAGEGLLGTPAGGRLLRASAGGGRLGVLVGGGLLLRAGTAAGLVLRAAPVGGLLLRTAPVRRLLRLPRAGPVLRLLRAGPAEGLLLGAAPVDVLLGTGTGGGLLPALVTREGLVGAVVAGEGLVGLTLRALGDLSGLGEDVAEFAHQALVDGPAVGGRGRACHRAWSFVWEVVPIMGATEGPRDSASRGAPDVTGVARCPGNGHTLSTSRPLALPSRLMAVPCTPRCGRNLTASGASVPP